MYKNKSFLAIIPARSGSKGIIDKNIKEIENKPLMAYTIEASLKAKIFDDIIVSTDSKKYAEIAESYGASVPFFRPKELSTSEASNHDVILHVLSEMKKLKKSYDYFVLLQPTSPLRNEKNIIESVDELLNNDANSVVSICEVDHSSSINIVLNSTRRLDFLFDDSKKFNRQDMKKEYRINGAIYMCKTEYFLKYKSFYKEKSYPYIMDKISSIDIDDIYQFNFAKFIIREGYVLKEC
ncbi:acylneuraminate cytidylyltransferase family protein [Clostridium hydrogenum]|uniref:acylneuraminate cytidylyltransferase family protein n=1 Tax=Clostridium hydrogenum TaxID=2855764 RepID=UPI001F452894|nr:acylneuraminate cytidylyltransferase family protein [Clostridium hydrogenum]